MDMLGNLKGFLSAVQDGMHSNNSLRQTLAEVQKVKKLKQAVIFDSNVDYLAGAELLDKYQQDWTEIHNNSEKNSVSAEKIDKSISLIHTKVNNALSQAFNLNKVLVEVPKLSASVDKCIHNLKAVHALIKEVENDLMQFEDLVDRHDITKLKIDQHFHLTQYREQKLKALDQSRAKFALESSEQNIKEQHLRMNELHTASADLFSQEMRQYLSTGIVPTRVRAAKDSDTGLTLDQVQLDLDADDKDFDNFLNS